MTEAPKQAVLWLARRKIAKGYVLQALHEYRNADSTLACWRIRCKHEDGSKWIRPMHLNGNGCRTGRAASINNRPETDQGVADR